MQLLLFSQVQAQTAHDHTHDRDINSNNRQSNNNSTNNNNGGEISATNSDASSDTILLLNTHHHHNHNNTHTNNNNANNTNSRLLNNIIHTRTNPLFDMMDGPNSIHIMQQQQQHPRPLIPLNLNFLPSSFSSASRLDRDRGQQQDEGSLSPTTPPEYKVDAV